MLRRLLMLTILLVPTSMLLHAETVDEFETQLDRTIRSACHGFMVDALPDFLSSMRSWVNENTPFCQTVRTLPESESVVPLFEKQRQQQSTISTAEFNSDVRRYYGRNDAVYVECNDWMCQHIRQQLKHDGKPISLADYQQVEAYCEQRYECIESWFQTWPRPLPELSNTSTVTLSLDALLGSSPQQEIETSTDTPSGLTFDDMMGVTTPKATPNNDVLVENEPTSVTSLDDKLNTASSSADTSLDNVFSGREEIALNQAMSHVNQFHQRLQSTCQCSVLSEGCYQLPAESLLNTAHEIEEKRYGYCTNWAGLEGFQPETSEQAETIATHLAKIEKEVKQLDNDMEQAIAGWHRKQERILAQQRQEQEDRENAAYFSGLASVLLQSGAAVNGLITPEQAAQNSVNVYNSISSGDSVASAFGSSISSINSSARSVPSSSGRSSSVSTGGTVSFACQKTGDHVCREYSVSNAKADQFKQQCQNSGFSVLPSCNRSQPNCRFSTAGSTQTTYYNNPMASEIPVLRENCIAGGGQFSH